MAKDRTGKQRDARRQARDANRFAIKQAEAAHGEAVTNYKTAMVAHTRELIDATLRRRRAMRL